MCSDNIASVLVKTWDMDSTLFDGELLAGPVPTLFSENVEASNTSVLADPLKLHWDMMKICKCFIMYESMSVVEAQAYIKKPRYEIMHNSHFLTLNKLTNLT